MLVGVSRIYPVDIYPYLISPFISSTIRNGETKTRLISYTMTAPVWLLGTPLTVLMNNDLIDVMDFARTLRFCTKSDSCLG